MTETLAAVARVLAVAVLAGVLGAQQDPDDPPEAPTGPPAAAPPAASATDDEAALRDVIGDEFAVLEVTTPRTTYFVHEPVPVHLRFGYDTRFFDEQAVSLFLRRLDLPLQVQATWLDGPAGAVALTEDGPPPEARKSFALNDGVTAGEVVGYSLRNGRRFQIVELRLRFLPRDPGELLIDGPLLRFAFGTRFRDDFVSGRVAEDRREAFVYGRPLVLTIRPLPEQGRPLEFSGAVGRFEVRADAFPRTMEQGRTFQLQLDIEGQGNVGHFAPPDLQQLDPFVWFGQDVRATSGGVAVTYELSPRSVAVKQVPPIPFAFFDTESRAYRTVRTDAIPLEVRQPSSSRPPLADTDAASATADAPSVADTLPDAPGAAEPFWAANWFPLASLVVLAALACWAWWGRRRLRSAPPDPDVTRRIAAARTFAADMADPDADVGRAFSRFLASCLETTNSSVVSPDLDRRLVAAGVEPEQAAAAAALLHDLLAVRYGGHAPADGAVRARALVDRMAGPGPVSGGRES